MEEFRLNRQKLIDNQLYLELRLEAREITGMIRGHYCFSIIWLLVTGFWFLI